MFFATGNSTKAKRFSKGLLENGIEVLSLSGYPLNSISIYKNIDKYFTEMTNEDNEKIKVSEDDVVDFIKNHM